MVNNARVAPALDLNREPFDVALGTRMRALRVARGMSLQKLGDALGVTYQQVQKYETGANRMSTATLVRVCATLECDYAALLGGVAAPTDAVVDGAVERVITLLRKLPTGPARAIVLRHVRAILECQ